jgi:hypothetical protein
VGFVGAEKCLKHFCSGVEGEKAKDCLGRLKVLKPDLRIPHYVLPVIFFTVPPLLEHLVDGLSEEERNLCPPPLKHPENDLENRKGKEHVRRIQKMSDKEGDHGD